MEGSHPKDSFLAVGTSRGLLFLANLETGSLAQISRSSPVGIAVLAAVTVRASDGLFHHRLAVGTAHQVEIYSVSTTTDSSGWRLESRRLANWDSDEPVSRLAWSEDGDVLIYSAGHKAFKASCLAEGFNTKEWLKLDTPVVKNITVIQEQVIIELENVILTCDIDETDPTCRSLPVSEELSGRIVPTRGRNGANSYWYVVKSNEGLQMLNEAEFTAATKIVSKDNWPQVSFFQHVVLRDKMIFSFVEDKTKLSIATLSELLLQEPFSGGILQVVSSATRILVLTTGGKHLYGLDWASLERSETPVSISHAQSTHVVEDPPVTPSQRSLNSKLSKALLKRDSTETSLLYGPPSESSTATSSNAVDLASWAEEHQQQQNLLNIVNLPVAVTFRSEVHRTSDSRCYLYTLNKDVVSLTAVGDKLFLCDSGSNVFVTHVAPEQKEQALEWQRLDWPARLLAASTEGTLFWRLDVSGAVSYAVFSSSSMLDSWSWSTLCQNVISCAISGSTGIILTADKVYVHLGLSIECPFSPEMLECSISEPLLAALVIKSTLLFLYPGGQLRSLSFDDTTEAFFEEEARDLTTPAPLRTIALGPSGSLLGIDLQNRIFCSSNWSDTNVPPHWLELNMGQNGENQHSVAGGDRIVPTTISMESIWSMASSAEFLRRQHSSVSGYRWMQLQLRNREPLMRICSLSARSIEAYAGHLYLTCLGPSSCGLRLLCLQLKDMMLHPVSLPSSESLARPVISPDSFLIMAASGTVYRRTDGHKYQAVFSLSSPWKRLRSAPKVADDTSSPELVKIELGLQHAWALDPKGSVLFCPDSSKLLTWVTVDCPTNNQFDGSSDQNRFVDLTCSADGLIVWGLESTGCLYARVAVYPELPTGTSWAYVEFIATTSAVQIAASR